MTKAQADELRMEWTPRARKGESCTHSLLVLESTERGYLTGSYFCGICGKHIVKKKATA